MRVTPLGLTMASMICIGVLNAGVGYADAQINVILNGKSLEFVRPPVIIDGRTLDWFLYDL
ncbi:hypothetical protein DNHGIG_00480 [Collibacillus ludicampi]|uniref:Uncharacterized protein n=1 Tax=Collibacillus ludicampi TaxID=2771369 RepID=A0AAV4L9U2_9BACL|nr:hypothetical protein DNHGIG_00480 [Collibacillus ludicampi]